MLLALSFLFFGGLASAQFAPTPPTAQSVEVLGTQTAKNLAIGRDLGYSGKIGNTVVSQRE